jgi:hypothetical protein
LTAAKTTLPHFTNYRLCFAEKTLGFHLDYSVATYFLDSLHGKCIADISCWVDEVFFVQIETFYVELHTGIAVLSIVRAAVPITTRTLSDQISTTIVLRYCT